MRIGVFSDTHGYAADGDKLAKPFVCPVYAVRGNCDYRSDAPLERQVDLGGKRFLLLHGHQYYAMSSLLYRAEEAHADMVLYGHTHMPDLSADGPRLLLNPGSLSRPRGGSVESCALILLEGNDLNVRFINADNAIGGW